ncbi:helix-turn-helix domain-containing protein [Holdemanella porci]|uniref:helix-turn-helix domain-containing protein n=1 Tax=Holdemanella porci TaxID=2652276 RepID=UPI0022E1684D|nr:helix-turn-helix transcriptional regulator [Holdemanella porci]
MKVKGKGQNIELNKMNESIEIKLDEAYKQTRMTEERLSNEEIFSNVRKMKTFDEMLAKQMKDEEFKKEYEAIQPEMNEIRASVDARTSQNLTQKELSERTGINQADISKLENGTKNPSINLLKR